MGFHRSWLSDRCQTRELQDNGTRGLGYALNHRYFKNKAAKPSRLSSLETRYSTSSPVINKTMFNTVRFGPDAGT